MNDREKIQKAFNQCSDALMSLDQKSILKVFHLLTVQFDISPTVVINQPNENAQKDTSQKVTYLPSGEDFDGFNENDNETKKTSKKSSTKKGKGSSTSPTYLSDFDFMPPNNEALKEFVAKYDAKNNMEYNLVFIYYLQEILHVSDISANHIYSCYRHLSLRIPSFPQTLIDTKSRKGWIDTKNTNDLKITREGINFIEHEMPKKDGEQS